MHAFKYILIICLLSSCQKQSPPRVTITAPTNGQVFKLGDIVKVQADLYDADALLGDYLTVVSGNNYSDTIFKFKESTYRGSSTLSKQFVIQTKDTIKIIVGAYGGSSITVEKEVFISAQ